MKIGIIGDGKMGKDIFSYYADKMADWEFVICTKGDCDAKKEAYEKTLQKDLRRKKIDETVYQRRLDGTIFTDAIADMADCDLVLECVSEDLDIKQTIFRELEKHVRDNCVLVSNTSSLELEQIFVGMQHKKRCFGLHFFYPMKLSGFVENNLLIDTDEQVVKRVSDQIIETGKIPLCFFQDTHMYLNQFLAMTIFAGLALKESYHISFTKLQGCFTTLFPMTGLLGILDGIGLQLMMVNPQGFRLERLRRIVNYGMGYMTDMMKEGCPLEAGKMLAYYAQAKEADKISDEDTEIIQKMLLAVILNEATLAVTQYTREKRHLLAACQDVLGLDQPLFKYAGEQTYEEMQCMIHLFNDRTGNLITEIAEKELWDRVFR